MAISRVRRVGNQTLLQVPCSLCSQGRGRARHLGHGADSVLGQPQDCFRTTSGQPQPGTQALVATQTGLAGLALTLYLGFGEIVLAPLAPVSC